MVSTRTGRRSKIPTPKGSNEDVVNEFHESSSSSSAEEEEDEEESVAPQAVVSSSSSSASSASDGSDAEHMEEESVVDNDEEESVVDKEEEEESVAESVAEEEEGCVGSSRLFQPHRTVGLLTTNAPYSLSPLASSSAEAFCTIPIGDRFQIVNTQKLAPVLVSQAVPGGGGHQIAHTYSDDALSTTLVTHGPTLSGDSCVMARHLTLYKRTQPIHSIAIAPNKHWNIVDMIGLGRTKVDMHGEKEGKQENATIVALFLRKEKQDHDSNTVPVVGNDEESSDDDDSDDEDEDEDCLGQVVLVLATRDGLRMHRHIRLPNQFQPTVAVHPSTYINKVVLGGIGGSMILVNVRSGKVVHTFTCLKDEGTITALEQSPAVDTLAVGTSTGHVHLVNVRHDATLFTLHHKNATGPKKKAPRVTSLSFRTDGAAVRYGIAPLAVGCSDGTISIWDLTPPPQTKISSAAAASSAAGRTLLCQMKHVHPGGVCKLSYLPQEPLLLSTGTTSNSILMHVFDNPNHTGRILRQRKGHTAPPCLIRYLHPGSSSILANQADGTDASSCQILSASRDKSFRVFSTARSVLDKEYSQGKGLAKRARELGIDKKELLLPQVVGMASSEARSRDWGDLVTIHRDHAMAYVWSTNRGAQSGPVLRQKHWNVSAMQVPPPTSAHATSLAMSSCGNFCLVGTKGGTIYKYNVQSGAARGTYPPQQEDDSANSKRKAVAGDIGRTMKSLEKSLKLSNGKVFSDVDKMEQNMVAEAKLEAKRAVKRLAASHIDAAVTGLAVDSLNRTLVSVGADRKLILWSFVTHAPHKSSPYMLPSSATKLCHVKDSDLAAIALEDYSVVIFDCAALAIVRQFGRGQSTMTKHTGPISDLAFGPDGRRLFTASLDGTVRVWDVPTSTCVDWLTFTTPPTSLTLSPTGEFFATSHAKKVGLSLWCDKSFFQTVHLDGAHPPLKPARMDDPVPIAEDEDDEDRDTMAKAAVWQTQPAPVTSPVSDKDKDDSNKYERPEPKEKGIITLSGLPPGHWKNLFHLELVKERNKPKEAPKKPPSAPFFLQWRGDSNSSNPSNDIDAEKAKDDGQEWDAAWSDDDEGETVGDEADPSNNAPDEVTGKKKRRANEKESGGDTKKSTKEPSSRILSSTMEGGSKRRRVSHYRSHLASLLEDCNAKEEGFELVTRHVATLGPSAIDVALSNLCHGMHDLEEGLHYLHLATRWLLEATQSRESYEAVNAYLHRFLHLHGHTIAGIRDDIGNTMNAMKPSTDDESERRLLLETIGQLRVAQQASSEGLREKTQQALCLLQHFSRMV
eukprot:scaffold46509_cov54-Attheya_sp.AAC.2